jgi:hypothetical protein
MIGPTRSATSPSLAEEGGNPMLYFAHPCSLDTISQVSGVGPGR